MRPSLRFLALAVIGWTGIRAATLGALPGAEIFTIEPSEAKSPPPIVPTAFPPIEPVASYAQAPTPFPPGYYPYAPPQLWPVTGRPVVVPVYYASAPPAPRPAHYTPVLPNPEPAFYAPIPPLDDWPLSRIAATSMPPMRSSAAVPMPGQSLPAAISGRLDRLQLSSWALLRGRQGQPLGPSSLASGGTLGGSQAGARLLYNLNRQLAIAARTSSDVGRRGGELAAGVRVQPVAGVPVWLTAERRQRLGSNGSGRSAFAVFAESGIYGRRLPWGFGLDAYLQGGVVGLRSRDAFVDGGLTFSRPLYRNFSGGLGLWGAAQPGVYRVDAGPRLTMAVRNNVRVHLDWRQQLAGNAEPGSGPAITLAGDF